MGKKVLYAVLIVCFAGLGLTAGNFLFINGALPAAHNFAYQVKMGLVAFCTLAGTVLGIFLSPLVMRGITRLTLAVEQYLQKTPTQDLVMGSVGLICGLIIANLIGSILSFLGWFGRLIWIILTVFLAYLGLTVGIKKREEIVSFFASLPRFGRERPSKTEIRSGQFKILDTSVIIDGRIADLCESGFIEGILLVPAFVLEELRHIADSSDLLKRNRGRRGLDILNKMRKNPDIRVQIYDNNKGLEDAAEVDTKLVKLAQKLSAKIITNDFNLNKVAELHGVKVLNINELANAVKPVVLPGEEMVVHVVKDGKEAGQGVAYLDDGTMIVVDGGRRYMNQTIPVLVTSVLQTAAGRMIFARPKHDRRTEGQVHYGEVNVIG